MAQVNRLVSKKPVWIGIAAGAVLAVLHSEIGLLIAIALGATIGYLFYARNRAQADHKELSTHIGDLLERVALLEYSVRQLRSAAVQPQQSDVSHLVPDTAVSAADAAQAEVSEHEPAVMATAAADSPVGPEPEIVTTSAPAPASVAPAPRQPSAIEQALAAAKAWLFGGNTVARVGVLVLFVGVAFLLRYVAERTQVPIELRLAGVALGAVVLLVFGWRLREKRPGYAVTLQGGAVGILYLTVFAALRLYDVLPPVAAFALLAVLAVFCAVLAIAQEARALAALGAFGGFLAPLLVSTGAGRIEILLAFYLLLNLGVLGIALFRPWRELNWIGFAFTFGVLGAWVAQRYVSEQYLMAQGFLAAFWLLFLAVSLLYALRQPHVKRGIFDTTLMFALPLAAFGIQSRLTSGFSLALAAILAAAAYLFSSWLLMKRRDGALRLLVEANFGVGVAFLTLAVPLAASAQWTAAAWALEGVALLWVGIRQNRALPVVAGLALHFAAAVALLRAIDSGTVTIAPQFSGFTLNLAVLAATAFISSMLLTNPSALARGRMSQLLLHLAPAGMRLVAWAWVVLVLWQPLAYPWYILAWCGLSLALMVFSRRGSGALPSDWIAGAAVVVLAWLVTEARDGAAAQLGVTTLLRLAVTTTAVTAAVLSLAGGAAQRSAAAALLVFGVLVWLIALMAETWTRVNDALAAAQIGLMIIAVTAAGLVSLARRVQWDWPLKLSWAYFVAHLVLAAAVVVWAVDTALMPSRHYGAIVWPLAWIAFYARLAWEEKLPLRVPASAASMVHVFGVWLLTAMLTAEAALRINTVAGVGWFHAVWLALPAIALWSVVHYATRWPMRSAPSAYASVAAPGLALFVLAWIVFSALTAGDPTPVPYLPLLNPLDLASLLGLGALLHWHLADRREILQRPVRVALGAAAFIALNAAALRAVHHLAGVPWNFDSLAGSLLVQAVLSLLWTTTAMALMVLAHRRALRPLWGVGAGLLAAVVVKLFFVDLDGQGTIERIVSFVGVGALILLIGYLAPVPPSTPAARGAA